jgi:hypothetical protein
MRYIRTVMSKGSNGAPYPVHVYEAAVEVRNLAGDRGDPPGSRVLMTTEDRRVEEVAPGKHRIEGTDITLTLHEPL